MKILYLACMYDTETYKEIFKLKTKPMQASGKYHMLMCEGLVQNKADVETIAILPINRKNNHSIIFRGFLKTSGNVKYDYLSVVNIKFIKQIVLFAECFIKVMKSKAECLVFDYLNIYASRGALLAAGLKGIKTLAVVTDMPEFVFKKSSYIKKCYKILSKTNSFVLLTKEMANRKEIENKPYIVLEGHANYQMSNECKNYGGAVRTVLYAGSLDEKYGITELCEAFANISRENEELHIYGDGPCRDDIIRYDKKIKNIRYFGNVPNNEVVQAELHATLLINPRSPEGEFTKYSFPSKTMEYMSTGTPVLMYRLPGMPEEYGDYLFFINNANPVREIGSAIRRVFDNFSEYDLISFGKAAKDFVLSKKNNITQSGKLIEFISNLK